MGNGTEFETGNGTANEMESEMGNRMGNETESETSNGMGNGTESETGNRTENETESETGTEQKGDKAPNVTNVWHPKNIGCYVPIYGRGVHRPLDTQDRLTTQISIPSAILPIYTLYSYTSTLSPIRSSVTEPRQPPNQSPPGWLR